MKLKKTFGILICGLGLNTSSALALDLVQALKLAQDNDVVLQAAHAEYLAVTEVESQSTASLLPDVSLSIFAQKNSTEISNATGSYSNSESDFTTDGYTLTLTQSLYNKQLFDAMDESEAFSAQALASFEASKQTLIIRLAQAYFGVLAAQDNVAFAEAEKKANARLLKQNQERFKVGIIAITDVKEAQAKYDSAVAQAIIASNELSNQQEALWFIIKQRPESLSSLKDSIPLDFPELADIKSWQDRALANNLMLRAAHYAVEAAKENYTSQRAGHYPTLNLTAQHSSTSADGSTTGFGGRDLDDTTIGLSLDIPIYSGGYTSSKIRQSAAELDQAKMLFEKQQRQTIQDMRTAYLGVQAAIAQVEAFKQVLISTESATEATELGFEVGTRTSVDVLLAQGNLFKSQRDYAKARYDFILKLLEIKYAAGLLAPADIQHINQWLSPS
ncbi:MAG: TolC family outer membrane protein [Gammaproteobacteria bacterium]|nr:TolC family outer membrane protein [Gammaproteobacteria bacterium]MCW8924370.1 TolC family outer membrane protein [Gammaproteobacteria bacterium]